METLLFSKPPVESDKALKAQTKEELPSAPIEVEEPSVSDQVRDMVLGKGQHIVEAYKEQIHPDDIRLNRIEIDISSGIFSNNSKSTYSFRDYSSLAPELKVGAEFWFTPFLGVYGNYMTSMSADVAGDSATRSRVTVQNEWTEIGFDIRKFFGMSRKANSVEFGMHFSEYKFTVPGDDMDRVQLKSTGIGLHFSSRIPVAPTYAWVFGGKLIPRVQHREVDTGIRASSGSNGGSSQIEASIGGEFKMSRQNQILWDITSSFEKNQFQGQAGLNDPSTGLKPKNVSVSNTFIFFSLGYRWGQ